jgi:hypothetical protein
MSYLIENYPKGKIVLKKDLPYPQSQIPTQSSPQSPTQSQIIKNDDELNNNIKTLIEEIKKSNKTKCDHYSCVILIIFLIILLFFSVWRKT